jgi:hypothetical protein
MVRARGSWQPARTGWALTAGHPGDGGGRPIKLATPKITVERRPSRRIAHDADRG